jgi:Predicted phosphoesterase
VVGDDRTARVSRPAVSRLCETTSLDCALSLHASGQYRPDGPDIHTPGAHRVSHGGCTHLGHARPLACPVDSRGVCRAHPCRRPRHPRRRLRFGGGARGHPNDVDRTHRRLREHGPQTRPAAGDDGRTRRRRVRRHPRNRLETGVRGPCRERGHGQRHHRHAAGVAGHTHEALDTTHDGVRLLNPGSVTGANPADTPTMLTATVENGALDVELHGR